MEGHLSEPELSGYQAKNREAFSFCDQHTQKPQTMARVIAMANIGEMSRQLYPTPIIELNQAFFCLHSQRCNC